MVIDRLPNELILLYHHESLSNAADNCLHDEIVFLFFADQVYLELVNDLQEDSEFSERKDLA